MRAAVFHTPDQPLGLADRDPPVPGSGEVLLRVDRCGICGSDLHLAAGDRFVRPDGFVFGHEYCGTVTALGDGVETLAEGDRVAAMPVTGCGRCVPCLSGRPAYCPDRRLEHGGYAQFALARARETVRLPESIGPEAALIEPLAVALHGVRLARADPGARAVVIGAGPIGLLTAYWLRRLGLGPILVTARRDRAAALAIEIGASGFATTDALAGGGAEAQLGGKADLVFECAGAPGTVDLAVSLLRPGGTAVIQGIHVKPATFDARAALLSEITLRFSAFFTLEEFTLARDTLASGDPRPRALITETIPLATLPDRFGALQRDGGLGKVLVDPWA